eukprot:351729-Chlamydomonas_euryale.AAC.12
MRSEAGRRRRSRRGARHVRLGGARRRRAARPKEAAPRKAWRAARWAARPAVGCPLGDALSLGGQRRPPTLPSGV